MASTEEAGPTAQFTSGTFNPDLIFGCGPLRPICDTSLANFGASSWIFVPLSRLGWLQIRGVAVCGVPLTPCCILVATAMIGELHRPALLIHLVCILLAAPSDFRLGIPRGLMMKTDHDGFCCSPSGRRGLGLVHCTIPFAVSVTQLCYTSYLALGKTH